MPDLNITLKPRLYVARNCAQVQSPFVLKGTAPETITVTVPATALTGAGALVATPTFTINLAATSSNQFLTMMGIG